MTTQRQSNGDEPSFEPRSSNEGMSLRVRPADATTIVEVSGEVDLVDIDTLTTVLVAARETGGPVVLDLSGVDFLAIAALRYLTDGEQCTLANPSPAARRLLDLAVIGYRVDGGAEPQTHPH